ncbi:DASH family cryptochrome [Flavobacterium sp. 25HG05S-40]|uniref:DASH family cryptochrome n=1 Tax=Flavobacterium sp. 25HG05S-40 TaxID=3458682 RepID=UPI004043B974
MKRAILWFKTDLHLHDNETLVKAIAQSDEVIPVYCFDEAQFKKTEYGFQKTGSFRAQFLLESVADLDKNLRALGSGLIIVKGKPEVEIPKIAKEYRAFKVFAKREVAYEEKQTEALVQSELFKLGCEFETFSTSTLYHAQDLPFSIKDIPDVFTSFRKKTEKDATIRGVFDKPQSIKSPIVDAIDLPTLEALGLAVLPIDSRAVLPFKGGETEALKRLQLYFFDTKSVATYKETRNGLIGADYSSKFSAWLAMGCISPRKIYFELQKFEAQYGANESTYWLVFELLWRDYFRFMMKKYHAKFFQLAGIQNNGIAVNKHNIDVLQSWIEGETGVDFVDANMKELKLTGFMSNRGRQNVASYLCNDLKLDWRYGASYFEQQLIDYDVCSNWGNWAYLAGVGNDPRGNRYFNIEKQAQDYDKNGEYRKRWLTD